MAQLLLSQGHWQQARQLYREIYEQNPKKNAHIEEILTKINQEYTTKEPTVPDSTTIIKAQIGYLNAFLKQIEGRS